MNTLYNQLVNSDIKLDWCEYPNEKPKKSGWYVCAVEAREEIGDSDYGPQYSEFKQLMTLYWDDRVETEIVNNDLESVIQKGDWDIDYGDWSDIDVIAWAECKWVTQ